MNLDESGKLYLLTKSSKLNKNNHNLEINGFKFNIKKSASTVYNR